MFKYKQFYVCAFAGVLIKQNYFMPSLGMSGTILPPPLSLHGVRKHSFIFRTLHDYPIKFN